MDEKLKEMIENTITNAIKATLGGNSSFNLTHGYNSLFGGAQVGIEPDVVSALMSWRGLGDVLPRFASPYIEMFLPFITGVEPTSGSEQSTECGDCISGETEACIQHIPTARVCRETQQMTITRVVDRLNRGDIDLTLLNRVMQDSPWTPTGTFSQQDLLNIAVAWALFYELPPLFAGKLSKMMYTGNPSNNIGQAYREFRGLEQLVNTGFRDAFTNVLCPALNSTLLDFDYHDVESATAPSFYEQLEFAHYSVTHNADRQGLSPVTHVVVMRPELWQIFSQLIPVQRVQSALMNWLANAPERMTVNFNGAEIINERDRMRQLGVVPLNGQMVRVVTDDGISELTAGDSDKLAAGEYASDVYVLPVSYLNNRPAMQLQYKDYRPLAQQIAGTNGLLDGFYRATPDGMFAWAIVQNGACFKVQMFTEPRVVLRTPQLAARIENVKYTPLQHLRSPDPDSPYFRKGGVSYRAPGNYFF